MSKREIKKIYNKTFQKYGDSPQAAHWGSVETQYFRFKILAEIADLYSDSHYIIIDYGCGLGDLFFYLLFHGFRGEYIGVDINENFINFARKKYAQYSQAKFLKINSEKDLKNLKGDYCLISGVFNNKEGGGQKNMEAVIRAMFEKSRLGVAFNALSIYAARKDKSLAYFDPLKTMKFCLEKISKFALLRHDYRGGNFTAYLYKEKGEASF
jgi:SAM-dependent methyltransferase